MDKFDITSNNDHGYNHNKEQNINFCVNSSLQLPVSLL